MHALKQKLSRLGIFLLLAPGLLSNCNPWTPRSSHLPAAPVLAVPTAAPPPTAATGPAPGATAVAAAEAVQASAPASPAGCLTGQGPGTVPEMLAHADRLLGAARPLATRRLAFSWNASSGERVQDAGVLSLAVGDLQAQDQIQQALNALQVAGFVTWLRDTPEQHLHILALPLLDPAILQSAWAPYLQAYWQSRDALPEFDAAVIAALKLPPCAWMVERGFAPRVTAGWWQTDFARWPDYAGAAAAYLADNDEAAARVAQSINWLGDVGREGPNTMCGPLSWAIMARAGAFPPDWGSWSAGPQAFWLAKPSENGRPWSLFPAALYQVYRFREPMGQFDFAQFPLYPGDFVYSYSKGDGYDHMFVVTEVDAAGNVYTVTNRIHVAPVKKVTIERVLLFNRDDPSVGIARNQWANDRVNGRTGHAGFDVFRWAWMEKDIQGQPVSYPVQPGDTLGLVAERWKTPAEQIARYNAIALADPLSPGQVLSIPPAPGAGSH